MTRKRSPNLDFSPRICLDIMAISPPYRMSIAKNPSRKTQMTNKQAEKFIMAASAHQTEDGGAVHPNSRTIPT